MTARQKTSIAEFFRWRRHPFSDAGRPAPPYMSHADERIVERASSLLSYGKSFAVVGPSGVGKSTLVQRLLADLDARHYQPVMIHYGGLQRNGLLRAVADAMGVDVAGRSIPLLTRIQKHIALLGSDDIGRFPVVCVDDAQLTERVSLLDLCSLMVHPEKKTVGASIVLVGDNALGKLLALNVMKPVRSRLTAVFNVEPLDEKHSTAFIKHRLENAKAPADLFDDEAMEMLSAHCRGNRRRLMNAATVLLDEAFFREEKTIGSQLILGCDLMNTSG